MLRIIEGQPGSGKTYYAVTYLNRFVEHDKLYDAYILRSDVLLVTNIDDLKVQHMSVEEFLNKKLYVVDIFKDYIKLNNIKHTIIIIDESQRYFSKEAMKQHLIQENELYFFFEYHRHLGCDIFLICQTVSAFSKRIVNLSEYIIRARQQSVSIPTVFLYDALDSITGDRLFIIKLKKDPSIFRLYKSFEFESLAKPKSVLLKKWIVGFALFLVPIFILFFTSKYLFTGFKTSSNTSTVSNKTSSNTLMSSNKTSSNTLMSPNKTSSNALSTYEPYINSLQVKDGLSSRSTAVNEVEQSHDVVCLYPDCNKYFLSKGFRPEVKGSKVRGLVCMRDACYFYYSPDVIDFDNNSVGNNEGIQQEKDEKTSDGKNGKVCTQFNCVETGRS